jgi:hypothetical protein
MGFLVALAAADKVLDAMAKVRDLLASLNPTRAVVIEVQNFTDQPLRLASHNHTHGAFAETPSVEIPAGHVDVFGSKDTSLTHGTEGAVTYESAAGFLFTDNWNNPVTGGNSCSATVVGTNSVDFEALGIPGGGDTANMQFTVRPGVTAPPIVRKGTATAGAVSDIAVTNSGPRGVVTAVRAGDGSLKLISWEVAGDGLSFQRLGDSANQAGEATDIDIARGRLFVVACRAGNGKLFLSSWSIEGGLVVRRGDSRDAAGNDRAGEASLISVVALSDDLFLTAVRNGSGNLVLITWRLEASGELVRVADSGSQAGTVGEIALVRVGPDGQGNHRAVTAVRSGDGSLTLISWAINQNGSGITRLSFASAQAGSADSIRAVAVGQNQVVTSLRAGAGQLVLISWSIDGHGAFTRLADTHGQAGAISSNALMTSPTGILSAVGTGAGLKMIGWGVSPEGSMRRTADSGEQAGAVSLVSLCPERLQSDAPICTAVRNASGDLTLIVWADV